MRLNDRFILQEYVTPALYKKYGNRAIRFISSALIEADLALLQNLEKKYDRKISCSINDWNWKGQRSNSGYRDPSSPYYKELSLHSMGNASDKIFKFKDTKARVPNLQVYDHILENQEYYYNLGIRRMEHIKDAKTWIHWDTCFTGPDWVGRIQIVRA